MVNAACTAMQSHSRLLSRCRGSVPGRLHCENAPPCIPVACCSFQQTPNSYSMCRCAFMQPGEPDDGSIPLQPCTAYAFKQGHAAATLGASNLPPRGVNYSRHKPQGRQNTLPLFCFSLGGWRVRRTDGCLFISTDQVRDSGGGCS